MRNKIAQWVATCSILLSSLCSADSVFQLRDYCPPGFELVDFERCELRSLYQQYPSLQAQGVGGLKTGLPSYRDGFSPQQIDLGRYLFFDPVLSGNQKQSCASCHDPELGFADGLGRALGASGALGNRSAPSLWNVAFLDRMFWDARATSLEAQLQGPLYSVIEMANTPEQLLNSLNGITVYRQLFAQAFPKNQNFITLDQIYTALVAFESSLISLNSRYDQYAHGYAEALNQQEIEGLNIFRSFVARCAECHTPPLFTNQQIAVIGTPEPEGMPRDLGAEVPFNDRSLRGGFKVPSLRNIAFTAPYMHSGRYSSLWDATEFYTLGRGHALKDEEELYLHWHIWEPELSELEIDRLVDFMLTLSDTRFMPEVPDVLPSGLQPMSAQKFQEQVQNALNNDQKNEAQP